MILFYNFSFPDHDQSDLTVQISQNIQAFRQCLSFDLNQIFTSVFLTFYGLQQSYGLGLGLQFQQSVNIHSLSCGNMVDHDTVLNRFYI